MSVGLDGTSRLHRNVAARVDDAVDAYLLARSHSAALSGQAFNLGGGPGNSASLLEFLAHFRELGIPPLQTR